MSLNISKVKLKISLFSICSKNMVMDTIVELLN